MLADKSVVPTTCVAGLVSQRLKDLHQRIIIAIGTPEVGIGGKHSIKGSNRSSSCFIHDIHGGQHLWVFAVLENTTAELCMIGGLHLSDAVDDDMMVKNIVTEIAAIENGTAVPDITADNSAVGYPYRHREVMKTDNLTRHASDTYQPIEFAVLN